MPIYEFRCGECGELFEELSALGADAAKCPGCGADGAQRVLSEPAPVPRLVKTGAGNRRQGERNRRLRDEAKRDFKRKMARERSAAAKQKGGEG